MGLAESYDSFAKGVQQFGWLGDLNRWSATHPLTDPQHPSTYLFPVGGPILADLLYQGIQQVVTPSSTPIMGPSENPQYLQNPIAHDPYGTAPPQYVIPPPQFAPQTHTTSNLVILGGIVLIFGILFIKRR